ncbi:MAG: Mur ligase family protein, partial [Hydrogenovibrio sp.]|nr:Mur ligase family protein [Hydrogenovibrio sp.]
MKPDRNSSLQTWIDWLLSLHAEEIDLGLARIREVAGKLDLLTPQPLVISVAGTNGKGSSVAMLSAIYQASGYQVGVYTSPHLLRFNERIQINGKMADDQAIVEAFDTIESVRGQTKLTYFEFSTLAALMIFKRQPLDVMILEVGLGGRLDAVNILDADASLITAIDIDHSDWLGDDRSVIALEKAGITRPHKIAICSDNDIPDSLMQYALEHQINLKCLGTDFSYLPTTPAWQFLAQDTTFSNLTTLPYPSLKGDFQLQNA